MFGNLPASVGDVRNEGSLPGLGRSPVGGNGAPLQYSCLENSMERSAYVVLSLLCALNILVLSQLYINKKREQFLIQKFLVLISKMININRYDKH